MLILPACKASDSGSVTNRPDAIDGTTPHDDAPTQEPEAAAPEDLCGDHPSCLSYCETLLTASNQDASVCATLPVSSVYVARALPGAICNDVVGCFRYCYRMCIGVTNATRRKACLEERAQCFVSRVDEVFPQ